MSVLLHTCMHLAAYTYMYELRVGSCVHQPLNKSVTYAVVGLAQCTKQTGCGRKHSSRSHCLS